MLFFCCCWWLVVGPWSIRSDKKSFAQDTLPHGETEAERWGWHGIFQACGRCLCPKSDLLRSTDILKFGTLGLQFFLIWRTYSSFSFASIPKKLCMFHFCPVFQCWKAADGVVGTWSPFAVRGKTIDLTTIPKPLATPDTSIGAMRWNCGGQWSSPCFLALEMSWKSTFRCFWLKKIPTGCRWNIQLEHENTKNQNTISWHLQIANWIPDMSRFLGGTFVYFVMTSMAGGLPILVESVDAVGACFVQLSFNEKATE